MIITVWWEDARQALRSKNYGPHALLAACVGDELGCSTNAAEELFESQPRKGAGNLRRALKEEAQAYGLAPLCAVFDRDKILDLWPPTSRPASCKMAICAALRDGADGDYKLVLLFQNMETVVEHACAVLGRPVPTKDRSARDNVLQYLAYGGTREQRRQVQDKVDGFRRLVQWTVVEARKLERV